MRKLILIAALAVCQFSALATSPAQCTPVANITTAADYLTAANWASCSGTYPCGTVGGAGSCAASGGFSVPYHGNAAQVIPAGVPGAQLQFSITAASWATNTVTLTISPTATGTALAAGSWMTITGVVCSPASPCLYNQQWVKAATVSGTTVTFALTSTAGTYASGGTIATSAGDFIPAVRSGFTLHFPSGLGIELGAAISRSADSLRIRGTNAGSRGVAIVDQGGYLRVHGYSSTNGNFVSIDQYGLFKVQPNGIFRIGEFINSPDIVVNGDFRSGCLDQVNFPDSTCSGNAGGWVQASVGSTLNFTATRSLLSGAYVAAGSTLSATGSTGQWCKVSFSNANGPATALVKLSGTNTVSDGAMLWVQTPGFGFAAAPTAAAVSSGTATCSGTANVSTTISTLPAGLSVGDIVTVTPVPQPFGVYPYTTDPVTGVTNPTFTTKAAPPDPPLMPMTNDTGGATHACGSLATCLVPQGTKLGVVAVSGDSVSLGWLQGGTTADPYWTGTETAMAITDAGKGWVWLSKPAFIEREAGAWNWATPISKSWSGAGAPMDALRTSLAVQAAVSNAAGTGPGRPGDNSLTFSIVTSGGTITQTNMTYQPQPWLVQKQGDLYANYDTGVITLFGEDNAGHINASSESHTGVTYTIPNVSPKFWYVPTLQSNNSLVIGNSYIQGLFMDVSTSGAINFANLYNDGAVHSSWAGYQYNVSHFCNSEVGFGSINFSGLSFQPVNPMLVWGNAIYSAYKAANTSAPHWVFGGAGTSTVSGVDLSNNLFADFQFHIGSNMISDTTQTTFSGVSITNNNARTDNLLVGDTSGHNSAWWSGLLFQDNFVTATGNTDGSTSATSWPGYVFPIETLNGTGINIQWNNVYGAFRCVNFGTGVTFAYNSCLNFAHHGIATTNPSATGSVLNVHIANNLFASNINNQAINVIDMGYDKRNWINGMEIDHNTITAPGNGSGGACWNYGDTDGNAMTLITGSSVHDNVCAPQSGAYIGSIAQSPGAGNVYHSVVRDYTANNSIQGTNSPAYQGNSPNSNNFVVSAYNCNVSVTDANGNYNTDAARNSKGLILQNPNNCSSTQSNTAFKYAYNSTTNRTVQWASDGVTYGAARQLNWDGTGTTSYTVNTGGVSAAKPNSTSFTLTLTASPFVVCGSAGSGNTSTSCPITRWALFLTKAGVTCTTKCAYVVVDVPATNKVTLTPCDSLSNPCTTITDADTFILLNPENTVLDSGGSNYVVYGITDAGALPTSTPSPDTGITIAVNDYYHLSPFGEPVVTGVPTTWTQNVDGSPITPFYEIPALGVSAEKVLNSGFYIPSGTSWKTASSTGSYIGAIPPRTIPKHRTN